MWAVIEKFDMGATEIWFDLGEDEVTSEEITVEPDHAIVLNLRHDIAFTFQAGASDDKRPLDILGFAAPECPDEACLALAFYVPHYASSG